MRSEIIRIFTLSAAGLFIILMAGCGADPQSQAAAKARQSTSDAIYVMQVSEDTAKAKSKIKPALSGAGNSGLSGQNAYFTSAGITFAEAQQQRQQLYTLAATINETIEKLSESIHVLQSYQLDREQVETLISGIQAELAEIDTMINGGADSEGAASRIKRQEEKLEKLVSEKQELEKELSQVSSKATEMQTQADRMLTEARSLKGDEKLSIQKQAYDIMKQRKGHLKKAQELKDRLEIVNADIAMSENMLAAYRSNLERLTARRGEINETDMLGGLRSQMDAIRGAISDQNEKLNAVRTQLAGQLDGYDTTLKEINTVFEEAAEEYQRIRARQLMDQAQLQEANCAYWIGITCSDGAAGFIHVKQRLAAVGATLDTAGFGQLIDTADKKSAEYKAKALENFDKVIEQLGNIRGSGDFSCAVTKLRLLAIYAKEDLLFMSGGQGLSDEQIKLLEELDKEAQQCDPQYSTSTAGRLISGNLDYVPQLKVDSETYYMQLKEQFQTWKTMQGEERKAEVQRLLGVFEQMPEPEDPEAFEKILGPERAQLEAELNRKEQPAADDPFATGTRRSRGSGGGGDPNSW